VTRPLIVLRPEPGLTQTLVLARTMGLGAIGAPLFLIEPVTWSAPDPRAFDAIIAGSANAFRHGGAQLAELTSLPVHAVGEATAGAARDAGFAVASVGAGGLQEVLDRLGTPLRVLRLAGERRVELRAPRGIDLAQSIVYRARPLSLTSEAVQSITAGAVALLHSGEAARHFADECDRLSIERACVALAALAPRIAEAAGGGWQVVEVAAHPNDTALLALAADMCHTLR
jgi:uroporphyrinogen-III synthase